MKKIVITIAIVFGLSCVSFGQLEQQKGGGIFGRGNLPESEYGSRTGEQEKPLIPGYNHSGDFNAQNETPLGSGIAMLLGLGGAYLVARRHKED